MKEYTIIFKSLSDCTRIRIMNLLIRAKKGLCVCEIMDSLRESHYNISRHLKELRIAGLVKEKKEGRWVSYCIVKSKDNFQRSILKSLQKIPENFFLMDNERLKARLYLREDGKCVIGLRNPRWKEIIAQIILRQEGQDVQNT